MDIRNAVNNIRENASNAVNKVVSNIATNPTLNKIIFDAETELMALREQVKMAVINLRDAQAKCDIIVKINGALWTLGWRPWNRYLIFNVPGFVVLRDVGSGVMFLIGDGTITRIDPNGVVAECRWQ